MISDVCWGWVHSRPRLERCDAHWHRPRRADWRAKAYVRAATHIATPYLQAFDPDTDDMFPVRYCERSARPSDRCTGGAL